MTALVAVLAPGAASAHNITPPVVREIIRLQGYLGAAPKGASVARQITVLIGSDEKQFFATDYRRFTTAEPKRDEPPEPDRIFLQGERAVLVRIDAARPEQRVTILAERRPGAADLFVLAADFCPDH
jgi:hypothetical protein